MRTTAKRPSRSGNWIGLAAALLLAIPLGARAQTDDPCAVTGAETVRTDRPHYLALETVSISGRGYGPSCDFTVRVDGPAGPGEVLATSDAAGNLAAAYDPGTALGDYTVSVLGRGGVVAAKAGFTSGTYVMADRAEYAPHDPVTISGRGWVPGETVSLRLHEEPPTHADRVLTATADASGGFVDTSFSPEQHDAGVAFTLTATGSVSTAQTTFGDSAVAFDSSSSGMSTGNVATSVSFPHTIGNGNNRLLVVTISSRPSAASNVKYGGVPMISMGAFTNPSVSPQPRVEFFYLTNPPTGAANVTYNITAGSVAGSVSFSGVYQPIPFGSSAGVFGTSPGCASGVLTVCGNPQPTVTLLNGPDDMILDALSISVGTGSSAVAAGSGQTKQWDIRQGGSTVKMRGTGSTKPATDMVTTMSWTLSASGGDGNPQWVIGAVPIQPVFPAVQFDVETSVTTTTAGSSFSVTVTALDWYFNTATTYAGTVHFTSTDGKAVLPADYTFVPGDNGSHTFTGVVLKTAGTWTISATDAADGFLSGTSPDIKVNAASLDHLALAPASASIPQGGSQSYTATALDPYDNSLGDVTGLTAFAIAPDGSCAGATCTANTAGPHSVTGNDSGKLGTASLIVLDTTPPETTVSSGPPDPANSNAATFTFTGSDNVTAPGGLSFRCQLDGGGFSACASPKNLVGLTEGSHTFQVAATDEAGNTDPTPAGFTWTVDLTPPDTVLDSGPSATTINTAAAFTFHSTEPGSKFQCRLDTGSFAPCASGQSYTGLALGPHSFEVEATDAAGNTDATPAVRVWTVVSPNTAPSITGLSATPNPANENDAVTLSVSFTDPDAGDTHTATILWGDGSPNTTVNLAAGVATFLTKHVYLDDDPTGTPQDVFTVTVTVVDNAGASDTRSGAITVRNLAPVVTMVTGPTGPIALGGSAAVVASFTDAGTRDTHTCTFAWNDTPTPTTSAGVVTESNGSGSCAASHTYAAAGIYPVDVTVADDDTGSAAGSFQYIVVYEATSRLFVTGGGWINSPAGSYVANASIAGKVTLGFNSRYEDGASAPKGETQFQFQAGNLNFKSASYDWLVISGYKAQYRGHGTINGSGDYGFILTAIDGKQPGGGGADRLRSRSTTRTRATPWSTTTTSAPRTRPIRRRLWREAASSSTIDPISVRPRDGRPGEAVILSRSCRGRTEGETIRFRSRRLRGPSVVARLRARAFGADRAHGDPLLAAESDRPDPERARDLASQRDLQLPLSG